MGRPFHQRRAWRVLRAPYKNKGAWTPYGLGRYGCAVTVSMPLPSKPSLRQALSLCGKAKSLGVLHAQLAMSRLSYALPAARLLRHLA